MVQEVTNTSESGISMIAAEDTLSNFAGAYFDIITEHSINIQNQITDNYLENNTAVQDHIAHSPITVTLSGLIGELVFVPNDTLRDENLKNAKKETKTTPLNKLSQLTVLLPPVSNAMQVAQNTYDYVNASLDRYIGIWKSLSDSNKANFGNIPGQERIFRLHQIYNDLLSLRTSNTAFVVETPFKKLNNMYIQSLSFKQGNNNYTGDISITLKQLRFAEVQTTKADEEVPAKYNAYARAQEENNGKAQGERVENNTIIGDWIAKAGGNPTGGIRRD